MIKSINFRVGFVDCTLVQAYFRGISDLSVQVFEMLACVLERLVHDLVEKISNILAKVCSNNR